MNAQIDGMMYEKPMASIRSSPLNKHISIGMEPTATELTNVQKLIAIEAETLSESVKMYGKICV